ncbi:asparagine synthase (glutamine-hydrolyzing) [Flavobacterium mesophilum]|uniref:asparagine synthase (glutamine-hydrolyzing) n=1 Tax=Flavobacterium mesophilum TaxID=3143495 RepID=UPI0031D3009B
MCGINGIISSSQNNDLANVLSNMNDLIIHRGPDEDGFFNYENRIFMAMRRLSIIDLGTGKQPISNHDESITIVFNGEIYNYIELRNKLICNGAVFKTNSDTEVVLKMYEFYGKDSFGELDGMFAFSIYDKTLNSVLIARDFFGEKPLYYTQNKDNFIWGSELKSIIKALPAKPAINKLSLNLFFTLTYIPAPYTIYENIHKLEANHYIEFNCNDFVFQIHEIAQKFRTYPKISKSEAKKMTHDMVQESVSSRSIADVSLGTFLSGGVDSSIISLCLAQQSSTKIETFSIGFDEKSFDESEKSRTVANLINSNHHEFIISEKDLTNNIDQIILNFDEPFADSSALASYLVSEKTKKHVTVALTGDGGDEIFGGYNKYHIGELNEKYTSIIPKSLHSNFSKILENLLQIKSDKRGKRFQINKLLKSINYEGDFYYNIISLGFHENEIKEILNLNAYTENPLLYYKNIIKGNNKTLNDFRNIDKIISLEGDMLVKVDRTSMLTSLECRAPFLNKELWNFANHLPQEFLINRWDKKHILKESFKEYFPKDFLNKSKKGFGVPVGNWLRSNLKKELCSYIDKGFIEKQNIFCYETISNLVNNHLEGKNDNTFRVWTFYCFQKWYKYTYE